MLTRFECCATKIAGVSLAWMLILYPVAVFPFAATLMTGFALARMSK